MFKTFSIYFKCFIYLFYLFFIYLYYKMTDMTDNERIQQALTLKEPKEVEPKKVELKELTMRKYNASTDSEKEARAKEEQEYIDNYINNYINNLKNIEQKPSGKELEQIRVLLVSSERYFIKKLISIELFNRWYNYSVSDDNNVKDKRYTEMISGWIGHQQDAGGGGRKRKRSTRRKKRRGKKTRKYRRKY